MYGKAVHGHMNITYLHNFYDIELSYGEEYEVCIPKVKL